MRYGLAIYVIIVKCWWAFLLLGLALLIWAAFVHPDWERPGRVKLHRWLKRIAWSLIAFSALAGVAGIGVIIEPPR
ncbi:MAG TPA: hypothetical protein VD973_11120 [Symbiobacteriaceae bacterium]|nr:hypothetical protein [Symbiobacteriaceae bacterium]